jgi:adenine deaminase
MRRSLASLLATATFACVAPAAAQQPATTPTVTAFTNVTVIPMDRERVIREQTVIVRGDRIDAMGPAKTTKVPKGATVIDGRGRYLLPGLAEMHGHIPPPNAPPELIENVLFLYVASGITTVRGMLGAPGQLELREKAKAGASMATR